MSDSITLHFCTFFFLISWKTVFVCLHFSRVPEFCWVFLPLSRCMPKCWECDQTWPQETALRRNCQRVQWDRKREKVETFKKWETRGVGWGGESERRWTVRMDRMREQKAERKRPSCSSNSPSRTHNGYDSSVESIIACNHSRLTRNERPNKALDFFAPEVVWNVDVEKYSIYI